jgi:hypothetical protein
MYSFLIPMDDELAQLAIGVPTYDSLTRSIFELHAYNLFAHGDTIVIEKMVNIKGHNSSCPCRSCQMKGQRNATGGETNLLYSPCHPLRRARAAGYMGPPKFAAAHTFAFRQSRRANRD